MLLHLSKGPARFLNADKRLKNIYLFTCEQMWFLNTTWLDVSGGLGDCWREWARERRRRALDGFPQTTAPSVNSLASSSSSSSSSAAKQNSVVRIPPQGARFIQVSVSFWYTTRPKWCFFVLFLFCLCFLRGKMNRQHAYFFHAKERALFFCENCQFLHGHSAHAESSDNQLAPRSNVPLTRCGIGSYTPCWTWTSWEWATQTRGWPADTGGWPDRAAAGCAGEGSRRWRGLRQWSTDLLLERRPWSVTRTGTHPCSRSVICNTCMKLFSPVFHRALLDVSSREEWPRWFSIRGFFCCSILFILGK